MMAWADKQTGELRRIFARGEPTPEYSAATHNLVDLEQPGMQALAKAGAGWDEATKSLIAPQQQPVPTPQEVAAEAEDGKQRAALAYLARLPPGVVDILVDRVLAKIQRGGQP